MQSFPTSVLPAAVPLAQGLLDYKVSVNFSYSSIGLLTRTANNNLSPWAVQKDRLAPKMDERAATDCFQPIATDALPSQITSRADHLVPKLGIVCDTFSLGKWYMANAHSGDSAE